MDDATNWTICGRAIGKATGWDQADTFAMQLYNLEPADGYKGPVGECVCFNFERGMIEVYDETGKVTQAVDLIEAVKDCRVHRVE